MQTVCNNYLNNMWNRVFSIVIFSIAVKDVTSKSIKHLGHKNMTDDGKIVGGEEASIQDYPYQVYLRITKGALIFTCGGSIISPKYVITAAHCLAGAQLVSVRAGSTNSDSGGTEYKAIIYYNHPRYNPVTTDYDISILQMLSDIELDGVNTEAVELPDANSTVEAGKNVTVTGWGVTTEGGSTSNTLMAVTVPVTTREYCEEAYGEGRITDRMFCAGLEEGGKDACQGDSGGPVVDEETLVLNGIVSWGQGCARPGYPGVYTDVPYFRDWITTITGI